MKFSRHKTTSIALRYDVVGRDELCEMAGVTLSHTNIVEFKSSPQVQYRYKK
jgi:hypothetical protein